MHIVLSQHSIALVKRSTVHRLGLLVFFAFDDHAVRINHNVNVFERIVKRGGKSRSCAPVFSHTNACRVFFFLHLDDICGAILIFAETCRRQNGKKKKKEPCPYELPSAWTPRQNV